SKFAEAAAAIESALTRFRTGPWAQLRYIDRAIQIAGLIAQRDASLAPRMFAALGTPFAVEVAKDSRLVTRAQMTRQGDFPSLCGGAVAALEPNIPWSEDFLRLRYDCYQA